MSGSPLILGLGSPHGDDQAGWLVVDYLRARGVANARKVADGIEVLLAMQNATDVVIVDASMPANRPGILRWFKWPAQDPTASNPVSTHGLGLVDSLRMADALGESPREVTIVTIEAASVAPASNVSNVVARAVGELADLLYQRAFESSRSHTFESGDCRCRLAGEPGTQGGARMGAR